MIRLVDTALQHLLESHALEPQEQISFAPPGAGLQATGKPTVDLYLYQVQQAQPGESHPAPIPATPSVSMPVSSTTRTTTSRLFYAISAWAATPQEEHNLLDRVLVTLLLCPSCINSEDGKYQMVVRLDQSHDSAAVLQLWQAAQVPLKPTLTCMVELTGELSREWSDEAPPGDTGRSEAEHSEAEVQRLAPAGKATDIRSPHQPPLFSTNRESSHPKNAPGGLELFYLGQFELYQNQQPIKLGGSKKAQSIFKYLMYQKKQQSSKDQLMTLFWPDAEPKAAAHNLQMAIYQIRALFTASFLPGEQVIFYSNGHYRLNPALPIRLDIHRFSEYLAAGQRFEQIGQSGEAEIAYAQAVEVYRGDFLEVELYEDWTIAPRAELLEMYLTTLLRLSNLYSEQGEYEKSIQCCRLLLAREVYREDAYRQLMECYAHLGQRDRAVDQFITCRRVLAEELDLAPAKQTLELYHKIVAGSSVETDLLPTSPGRNNRPSGWLRGR